MAELKVPWEEAGKLPWRDKSRVKVGCRGFQGRIHVGGQKKALAKEAERGGGVLNLKLQMEREQRCRLQGGRTRPHQMRTPQLPWWHRQKVTEPKQK